MSSSIYGSVGLMDIRAEPQHSTKHRPGVYGTERNGYPTIFTGARINPKRWYTGFTISRRFGGCTKNLIFECDFRDQGQQSFHL
jgi:hypothetical protein